MLYTALVLWQHAYLNEGEVQSVSRLLISITQLIFFRFHTFQERFLRWIKPPITSLLLGTLTDRARGKSELLAENALLRHQLIILRRQVKRPIYRKTDRFLLVVLASWDIRSQIHYLPEYTFLLPPLCLWKRVDLRGKWRTVDLLQKHFMAFSKLFLSLSQVLR